MQIRIFTFMFVILTSIYGFASDNNSSEVIENKEIRKLSFDDENNRVEALTKEVQELLARIELLEHNLSSIQRKVDSMNVVSTQSLDNSSPVQSANLESQGGENIDVFDASSIKEIKINANNDEVQDKKLYDLALATLKDNKLNKAEEQFSTFLEKYPNSKLRSNAYFWYGEIFFRKKIFDIASINYLKGYKHSPKGPKASDSLLKLAISLGELNKKKEACSMINKLETEFPSRPATSIKMVKDIKIKFGCK